MNDIQFIEITLLLALATAITRFLPFVLFCRSNKTPKIIDYLGKVLPAAMMGLLVIYCFKDISFNESGELIPILAASLAVILVHLWKRNTILSITCGTVLYMVLIRVSGYLFF